MQKQTTARPRSPVTKTKQTEKRDFFGLVFTTVRTADAIFRGLDWAWKHCGDAVKAFFDNV